VSTLEELRPNAAVRGILPDALATVVSAQWYGGNALELTYKAPDGKVAKRLLYRHDERASRSWNKGGPRASTSMRRCSASSPRPTGFGWRISSTLFSPCTHRTSSRCPTRYDIESRVPGTGKLRFIEVESRVAGSDTIMVTRNEILYSLNKPDDFILAIVELRPDRSHGVYYLRRPFHREPDFGVTSVNYDHAELLSRAERVG